jgi:hypothetical protein
MALSLPSFVACPQWTLPGGFVVPVWEDVGVGAMWAETWWQERQAAQMAAWRARREQKRRVREEFAEARRFGLAARHATKLARIHAACAVTEDGTFRCAAEPTFSDWCPRNPAPVERSSDAAGPAVVGAVRPVVGRGPSSAATGARRGSVVAARVRVAAVEGSSDVAGVAARVRVAPAEGSSDVAGPSARTGQPAATTAGQPAATTAGQSAVAAADPPAVAAVGSPAVAAARLAAEATRPHTAPRRPAAPIAERPTAATAEPPMVSTTRTLSAAGQRTSATARCSAVAAQPTGTVAAGRSAPAAERCSAAPAQPTGTVAAGRSARTVSARTVTAGRSAPSVLAGEQCSLAAVSLRVVGGSSADAAPGAETSHAVGCTPADGVHAECVSRTRGPGRRTLPDRPGVPGRGRQGRCGTRSGPIAARPRSVEGPSTGAAACRCRAAATQSRLTTRLRRPTSAGPRARSPQCARLRAPPSSVAAAGQRVDGRCATAR